MMTKNALRMRLIQASARGPSNAYQPEGIVRRSAGKVKAWVTKPWVWMGLAIVAIATVAIVAFKRRSARIERIRRRRAADVVPTGVATNQAIASGFQPIPGGEAAGSDASKSPLVLRLTGRIASMGAAPETLAA